MRNRFILTPYMLDQPLPALHVLAKSDWEVNLVDLPEAEQQIRMSTLHRSLASRVAEALRSGMRPVSVAGDCCSAIGVAAGMQQAGLDPALIWLDAHGDFNTWDTTPSGFIGGMPLAMLVGRGEQTMPAAAGLRPLREELVILSDARDLDPDEGVALRASRVEHVTVVAELKAHPFPDRPLHVHFDPDILDPNDAPAMSFPAAGGPGLEEVRQAMQFLAGTGQVMAVSMATWDPELDTNGATAEVCMQLLRVLLGD